MGQPPIIIPVGGACPELSAGLTLLDTLLSTNLLGEQSQPTITLLNIAPRDGGWPNGVPFCYFWHHHHLVVSTLNARALALVRRNLDVKQVYVTDVREVMETAARTWAAFDARQVETIAGSQFRSLWYLPLLAKWISDRQPVPARLDDVPLTEDEDGLVVSIIDNFGNCKLNWPAETIGHSVGKAFDVLVYHDGKVSGARTVPCYRHLVDVPRGEAGLVIGSSGFGFIELVVRCGSAAAEFGLEEGRQVF